VAKQVITGRVPPSTKESIKILSETEGVTVGSLLEMALELYIPQGLSAREWQIEKLTKQVRTLKGEQAAKHLEIDQQYDPAIERLENHLNAIRAMDRERFDKVNELIPRWVLCHDLDHRRSEPRKIVARRANSHPDELVEWFKPFGIEITWTEFSSRFASWEEAKSCRS